MNDLTICKKIAEIEGLDFYLLESGEDVYPLIKVWSDSILIGKDTPKKFFTAHDYNPLTDDALIFKLAFKYKVKIDYFDECVYMKYPRRKLARHCFDKDNIASLRKAICLAIIEAHKDNL